MKRALLLYNTNTLKYNRCQVINFNFTKMYWAKPVLFFFLIFFNVAAYSQNDEKLESLAGALNTKIQENAPIPFLFTDKNIYSPGEKIDFIVSLKNYHKNHAENPAIYLMVVDETGSIVVHEQHNYKNINFAGSIEIPEQARSGKYTLLCFPSLKNSNNPLCYKELIITNEPPGNAFFEISFDKSNFIAQQTISGNITVYGSDNNPLGNIPISLALLVNSSNSESVSLLTDNKGQAEFSFNLAQSISGDNYYGIKSETRVNDVNNIKYTPVPVYTKNNIRVDFFPEGGNLISNIPGNVVVRVTDKHYRPLKVSGFVYDNNNTKLARIETNVLGYARFKLLAGSNAHYFVKLSEPELDETFALGFIKNTGLSLSVDDNYADKINVTASCSPASQQLATIWYIVSGGEVVSAYRIDIQSKKTFQIPYSILHANNFSEIVVTDTAGNILANRVVYRNNDMPESTVKGRMSGDTIVLSGRLPEGFTNCNISVFPINNGNSIEKTLLSSNNLSKLLNNSESFLLSLFTNNYSQVCTGGKPDTLHLPYIEGLVVNRKDVPLTEGNIIAVNPSDMATKIAPINKNGVFKIRWDEGTVDLNNLLIKTSGKIKNAKITLQPNISFNHFQGFFPETDNWEAVKLKLLYTHNYPTYLYSGEFKKQEIKLKSTPEHANVLDYARYASVLDIVKSKKPLLVTNNKIFFLNQGINTNGAMDGALVIIDGQNMGQNVGVMEHIDVKEVAEVYVSTNFVDIQRYSALNTMGIIEIKTHNYVQASKISAVRPGQPKKNSETLYSAFKQQNVQDYQLCELVFTCKNKGAGLTGIISAVNDKGDFFIEKITVQNAK
ncbi:MAG: hypothetical protein JXB34_11185 [Bacteroidales bacterium]|nr:hypothetical protein [Bacteroidales bacterium]